MRIKLVLISISLLLIGCALNQYMVADKYLERNDYESALKEYIRIAEMNGSLAMSKDVRALTGAMIAYYNLADYKKSFSLCKRILSINRYSSCAIFYAGMNLEMLNKKSLAKKLFAYYRVLSQYDPYYKFIKAKFNQYVQEEVEKRMQMAIQMENSLTMDQVNAKTLAVLYFLNVLEDSEWNSLSKGLAEMMITDLSQIKQLKVLERVYVQKLIEEMHIGVSGLADENTVPRMGRLLKARNLINGAFTIKAGQNLTITSNLVDISSQSGSQSKEFEGALKNIFELEKNIVLEVVDQLGITLTPDEKSKINKIATRNFEAFRVYCKGLDEYDLGDYEAAQSHFEEAIKLDPNFSLAQDMFDITGALSIIEQGKFSKVHFEIVRTQLAAGSDMPIENATQYRLNQISLNLDLGYLPGTDSRNGASDLMSQQWFWNDEWQDVGPLAPPPAPPQLPPNK